jgi:hypothetical protein
MNESVLVMLFWLSARLRSVGQCKATYAISKTRMQEESRNTMGVFL